VASPTRTTPELEAQPSQQPQAGSLAQSVTSLLERTHRHGYSTGEEAVLGLACVSAVTDLISKGFKSESTQADIGLSSSLTGAAANILTLGREFSEQRKTGEVTQHKTHLLSTATSLMVNGVKAVVEYAAKESPEGKLAARILTYAAILANLAALVTKPSETKALGMEKKEELRSAAASVGGNDVGAAARSLDRAGQSLEHELQTYQRSRSASPDLERPGVDIAAAARSMAGTPPAATATLPAPPAPTFQQPKAKKAAVPK